MKTWNGRILSFKDLGMDIHIHSSGLTIHNTGVKHTFYTITYW